MYLRSGDNALINNGAVAAKGNFNGSGNYHTPQVVSQLFTDGYYQGAASFHFNKDTASGACVCSLQIDNQAPQQAANYNTGQKIATTSWGFWADGHIELNTQATGAFALDIQYGGVIRDASNNYLNCTFITRMNSAGDNCRQLNVMQTDNHLCQQMVIEHKSSGSSAVYSFYDYGGIGGPYGTVNWSGSDWNLKNSVTEITDTSAALARINALGLYEYEWKSDGRKDRGVLAQDAGLVDDRYTYYTRTGLQDDGTYANEVLSVSHNALIGDLIGAVQALSADNEALRKRIEALEAKGV